ncbi:MAG: hypothetical protein JW822_04140 [Spirochaetales bacterium]|nr:hypothetical protein [Spirochaetales bacterium]
MKKTLLWVIFLFISLAYISAEMINGTVEIYNTADGKKIGTLYDGTKIKLITKQGSWYKIAVSFKNHKNMYQALKAGSKETHFLYENLLGRIGYINKDLPLQAMLAGDKITIEVFVKNECFKDTVKYYLEGKRVLTSPRSVHFSFSKAVPETEIKKIINNVKNIDSTTYDQDVLYIEVGYTDDKPTTVLCYSLIDGAFAIKERYHCDENGMPVKYITGYDPVESHVFTYYNNNAYKEFYWSKSPQTSIYSQSGYIKFVLYTEEYEFEINITLSVAENEFYDPSFYVLADTATIFKIDRISGQTVQKQEFEFYTRTEETLWNIEHNKLFKEQILKIQSGINFKKEFAQIIEDLLIFYR